MAKDLDNLAGKLGPENTGGLMSGFLAEEDEFDRRALWRLGSWAAASVGAVIIALLANQSSIGIRREQLAAADLARQSQQIQSVAKESQGEAKRLASAIETLNSDRDRLYSRVAVLEQGLDSVTGAIARQNPVATSPQAVSIAVPPAPSAAPAVTASVETPAAVKPTPAPVISPVAATPATTTEKTVEKPAEKPTAVAAATEPGPAPASSAAQASPSPPAATPSTPLVTSKSIMAPPDPAAAKLLEPNIPPKIITAAPIQEIASAPPAEAADAADPAEAAPKLAVQRTEFGVDVGGANSIPGLRALWRGLLKSRANAPLTALRPIIVIKEGSNGLGMQLRLVAGPIRDAAAAAKICAGMIANDRGCTTTVFEGQRLAVNADEPAAAANAKPAAAKPADLKPASAPKSSAHRHYTSKRTAAEGTSRQTGTIHLVADLRQEIGSFQKSSVFQDHIARF